MPILNCKLNLILKEKEICYLHKLNYLVKLKLLNQCRLMLITTHQGLVKLVEIL